jgi:hypothetical protein
MRFRVVGDRVTVSLLALSLVLLGSGEAFAIPVRLDYAGQVTGFQAFQAVVDPYPHYVPAGVPDEILAKAPAGSLFSGSITFDTQATPEVGSAFGSLREL